MNDDMLSFVIWSGSVATTSGVITGVITLWYMNRKIEQEMNKLTVRLSSKPISNMNQTSFAVLPTQPPVIPVNHVSTDTVVVETNPEIYSNQSLVVSNEDKEFNSNAIIPTAPARLITIPSYDDFVIIKKEDFIEALDIIKASNEQTLINISESLMTQIEVISSVRKDVSTIKKDVSAIKQDLFENLA